LSINYHEKNLDPRKKMLFISPNDTKTFSLNLFLEMTITTEKKLENVIFWGKQFKDEIKFTHSF
jgi:hypothetical protein